MVSEERRGSFWWEDKAKLALHEDKERRYVLAALISIFYPLSEQLRIENR